MKFEIENLEDLKSVAVQIVEVLPKGVVLLQGSMGAGKTTLITQLLRQLGVDDNVSSPTFSLVNEYISSLDDRLFHFDFYRIESEEEAMDMGYEDYFWSGDWCFVEWPEKIPNLLPEQFSLIKIEHVQSKRTISVDLSHAVS